MSVLCQFYVRGSWLCPQRRPRLVVGAGRQSPVLLSSNTKKRQSQNKFGSFQEKMRSEPSSNDKIRFVQNKIRKPPFPRHYCPVKLCRWRLRVNTAKRVLIHTALHLSLQCLAVRPKPFELAAVVGARVPALHWPAPIPAASGVATGR